jgi:N,N'-diacetyllegionaminate synthase
MGAEILEFHFTDTRDGKLFRDHKVSLTCNEVKELIKKITIIQELQGDGYKKPLPIETENEHDISFRRAVYLNKDLPAKSIITEDDIICLRPLHGIDAREADSIIGRKTLVNIPAFTKLDYSFFE